MANALIADSRSMGSYSHGMLYYNGYIYIVRRDDAYCAARVYRIRDNNYTDIRSPAPIYGENAGLTDIIRIGEYLYVSGHRAMILKIDITTPVSGPPPTFKISEIPITSKDADCLCTDDTYLYVGHVGFAGRITRVHLTTLAVLEWNLGAGLNWHGIIRDGNYLYAHDVANGRLYRINKSTMAVVDYAVTGKCTDDMAQDDNYVYLGREFTTAGIVRVAKSDMAVTVYTPGGIGFSYGVFYLDGRIFYLDFANNYIWEFDSALTLIETWVVTPPDSYDGINEMVYDGERFFHSTLYDTPGMIKYALGVHTYDETGREQVILVKAGEIQPIKPAVLAIAINNSYVDVTNAKISYRTINQGHSLFTAMVDNNADKYINSFDARDKVSIVFRKDGNYYEIFRGVLDSGKHVLTQDDKWNFSDRIRLGGRDMSYALANFKYTKTWPLKQQVVAALYEAFAATKCGVSISYAESPEIDGKTSVDKYLLDMVTEMFEIAGMEGYVDVWSLLHYFELDDPPSIPLTFDKSNVLSATPVEFDGLDVKNSVEVLGELNLEEPEIADDWTDYGSLKYWEKIIGDTLWINTNGIVNLCVKCSTVLIGDWYRAHIRLNLPNPIRVGYHDQYKFFDFWFYAPSDLWPDNDMFRIYLMSPGGGFYTDVDFPTMFSAIFGSWKHFRLELGAEQENCPGYPNGAWHPFGPNPDWLNITKVEFYGMWVNDAVDDALIFDSMKFTPKRTHYLAENQDSIRKYGKREHIVINEQSTNAECKYAAESLCEKMSYPVSILQIITPLETFIIDGAWEGKVGHTVEVDLGQPSDGTYRIQDITADIAPYENILDGYEAIATVNLVKVDDSFHPDAYASTARPKTASLLKRYVSKGK